MRIATVAAAVALAAMAVTTIEAQPASTGSMPDAGTITAHDVFAAADSALARVATATYVVTRINQNIDGEVDTLVGRVFYRRDPEAEHVGFRARFEMPDHVLAFDGTRTLSLASKERTVTQWEPTVTFDRYLRGNVAGQFVRVFQRTSPFTALDSVATLDGIVDIAGVPSYSISLRYPDEADMKNPRARWCFGVADGFPRRYEFSGEYLGQYYADTLTFSDVRLNGTLVDSLFTVSIPEGYTFDTLKLGRKPDPLAVGARAPAWKLELADGTPRALADLRGKVVVLDFWYIACAPCQLSMPLLSDFQKRHSTDSVVVLGVNVRDSREKIAQLFAKKGFSYASLTGGDRVARDYAVAAFPTMIVVRPDGAVAAVLEGHSEDLVEQLEAAVAAAWE